MGFLEFLSAILALPSRIGAGVALGALSLYLLRKAGFEPFSSFDPALYRGIVVVGLIGAAISVVEGALIIVRGTTNLIASAASRWQISQSRRKLAKRSMDALQNSEYAGVLWYLGTTQIRSFAAKSNGTLYVMVEIECLLDRYEPAVGIPMHACYRVPRYVWRQIEKRLGPKFQGKAPTWLANIRQL
jgi:hypothetical protein